MVLGTVTRTVRRVMQAGPGRVGRRVDSLVPVNLSAFTSRLNSLGSSTPVIGTVLGGSMMGFVVLGFIVLFAAYWVLTKLVL